MSAKTGIEWTDSTWSPLRVRVRQDAAAIAKAKGYTSLIQIAERMAGHIGPHCEHISPGCENCYSGTNNHRCLSANGTGLPFDRRSRDLVEPFVDGKILHKPFSWKVPRRIFVENQSDLFGDWVTDGQIFAVWQVMAGTRHTYQILTKRPERMLEWMRKWNDVEPPESAMDVPMPRGPEAVRKAYKSGRSQIFASWLETLGPKPEGAAYPLYDWMGGARWWPSLLGNVHLGVSVENQATADTRIPLLLQTPAAIKFVSYEPALEGVDFDKFAFFAPYPGCTPGFEGKQMPFDWLIIGGESGPGARPFDVDWARKAIAQCRTAGVAPFFKQAGAKPWDSAGAKVDHLHAHCGHACECCDERPPNSDIPKEDHPQLLKLKDKKGGDMSEWPEDLRGIREFPEVRA